MPLFIFFSIFGSRNSYLGSFLSYSDECAIDDKYKVKKIIINFLLTPVGLSEPWAADCSTLCPVANNLFPCILLSFINIY